MKTTRIPETDLTAQWLNKPPVGQRLVIYDGVCNFCNGAARFIAARDPQCRYRFTPMQSNLAQALIQHHGIPNVGVDTFLLIKQGRCHVWTDAAFEIAKELRGYWFVLTALRVIPRPLRDAMYRWFARNRYRLFGRTRECQPPGMRLLDRFLDLPSGALKDQMQHGHRHGQDNALLQQ